MKMTFEVGDKVQLKEGLKIGRDYGGVVLLHGMVDRGVITIEEIDKGHFKCGPYWYSEEMLEPADEEEEDEADEAMAMLASAFLGGKFFAMLCACPKAAVQANGYALVKALYAEDKNKENADAFMQGVQDALNELLEDK